nr:uncharacterized protein LOC111420991 [Onthophagus taurus]
MTKPEPIKDFINFHYVRITPSKMIFQETNFRTDYQAKLSLQNVGKSKVMIRILQPTSKVFQIETIPTGIDLPPGLKIIKTIKVKKLDRNFEKECLIPIYVNDYKYDFLAVLSPPSNTITVTPSDIDFGLLNIGTLQVSQTLTISNATERDFSFQVDLRRCGENVIVEPIRGRVKGHQSYQVIVRVVTVIDVDIEYIIYVKCAFQYIPVRIKGKVIFPKMEVIHPNATETFTCLIFPPTYYGIQCSINLFIRNYSATGYMFGTFGDILDKYIEIDKARIERMDFKFFDMTPSDGVFQSNETRVFKFTFSPFQIDKNTKNIPYFFCKYVMFRFLCDHYFGPTADVEGTFQSSYSNVAFCRNVASSRCNTFRRDSVSIYIFSKEKSHHFSVTQTDDNYTRFYLYGTAEPPSVKIIPDSLIIENITINMRETRVIELKNNSKNLPIIFRYKKIPFIFLESEYFHVKSLGSIQISVHIAPKRLGRINTHLEFDLMYYNNNELKVIGETKINIEYNVSIISKKLKKYSISSLKPITLRDKIKSVTLSNLFHIEKNNDYYNTFIRRKQFIKSKSMVSFSGNEEYDVTDMRKVVCKDLKLSKCGKLVLNEKIKRNMFFFPLTPQEMANVVVLPPVIKTPRRAERICDKENLRKEERFLEDVLQKNGYTMRDIRRATKPHKQKDDSVSTTSAGFICLPYVSGVTERIARRLRKNDIVVRYGTVSKIQNALPIAKDKLTPLKGAGVYRLSYSCGKYYVGQTGRNIECRIKEHERDVRLRKIQQSAVAEHCHKRGHSIEFEKTKVLARNGHYFQRLTREAAHGRCW